MLWASQGFVEAYNVHRYEGGAGGPGGGPAGGSARTPGRRPSLRGAPGRPGAEEAAAATGGQSTRGRGGEGYTLIRSDVEEDPAQSLPQMPRHALGVRQRTLQHLLFQHSAHPDQQYRGPMHWVESAWFHGLSGLVIFANAIVIGLETDIETPVWFFVEQLFLSYFVLELASRLARHGCRFFRHEDDWAWNVLDLCVVLSGVLDQWALPLAGALGLLSRRGRGSRVSAALTLARLARLLRIVRLFRLVRSVRPLYQLAQGVLEALQGMFWVLVFMVMTLYSAAVLCTRLLGQGDLLAEDAAADEEVREIRAMFSSVDESMFTLFGTMSSWSLLKFVPLFEEIPALRPLFVLFYVYSAWALLAVMTGVVSENMIAIREQMVKEDELREETRKTLVTQTLMDLFREADSDCSGTVSRDEFNAMLRSPDLIRKITKNTHMKVQDLQDLFEWLDHDGVGTVTVDEFMTGFRWANEPLRARSLVKLQERLTADLKSLETSITSTVCERTREVQRLVAAPLRKVHALTEQLQDLDLRLTGVRGRLREAAAAAPAASELRGAEERLAARLAAAAARLEALGRRA